MVIIPEDYIRSEFSSRTRGESDEKWVLPFPGDVFFKIVPAVSLHNIVP
jgi:hypothetical protein